MTPELLSVLAQIPLVAAFVWFALEMLKRQERSTSERDQQWREFLKDQRETDRMMLRNVVDELSTVAHEVSEVKLTLMRHDTSMSEALGAMRERMRHKESNAPKTQ